MLQNDYNFPCMCTYRYVVKEIHSKINYLKDLIFLITYTLQHNCQCRALL